MEAAKDQMDLVTAKTRTCGSFACTIGLSRKPERGKRKGLQIDAHPRARDGAVGLLHADGVLSADGDSGRLPETRGRAV